jgi:branched-chain amino acid transport system permease protein
MRGIGSREDDGVPYWNGPNLSGRPLHFRDEVPVTFGEAASILLSIANASAMLVIVSVGLAVMFGLMGVINFAHGEFLMLGAFVTLTANRAGIPLAAAMLAGSLAVGAFGIVVERVLIRRFYSRLESTMLVTFGLSLIMVQGAIFIWGTRTLGIPTPLGRFDLGGYSIPVYRLVLIAGAAALLVISWFTFTRTRLGLMARATTADAEIAAALGIDAQRLNMYTFGFGAALAGAGGALLAPVVAVTPTMGAVYIPQAFMTVVVGGQGVVTGTAGSAGVLGMVFYVASDVAGPVLGVTSLMLAAIVIVRLLPSGISGKLGRDL